MEPVRCPNIFKKFVGKHASSSASRNVPAIGRIVSSTTQDRAKRVIRSQLTCVLVDEMRVICRKGYPDFYSWFFTQNFDSNSRSERSSRSFFLPFFHHLAY